MMKNASNQGLDRPRVPTGKPPRARLGSSLCVGAALLLGAAGGLWALGLGCGPTMSSVEGGGEDLGATTRDLRSANCEPTAGNLLVNPGFEVAAAQGDGNGQAKNTGLPPSTISGWDGCCTQAMAANGTTWLVTQSMPRCGLRAVFVSSSAATENVLDQTLTRGADVGRDFVASGWVYLYEVGSGAQLKLDVFDDTAKQAIYSSTVLSALTPGWTQLTVTGKIPAAGRVQLRVNSSGTLKALVDDLAFTVP